MKYLLALLIVLLVSPASAQLFPSRSFIVIPAFRDSSDITVGAAFLTQNGMWGNLSRGFGSEGERFAWDIAFGGFFELVQWQHSGISLVGDFEVLSDTYNDISFNPRAIFWTEGLLYSIRWSDPFLYGKDELSVGYIHRCRHDIDNLDNNTVGSQESRGLIYGSLMLRNLMKDIPFLWGSKVQLALQLDQYLIKQDDRYPISPIKKFDMNDLNSSITATIRYDLLHWGDALIYMQGTIMSSAYDSYKTWSHNSRVELGTQLSGNSMRMNLFLGRQSFEDDDFNRPIPVPSNYLFVGFRFVGKNVGL